MAILLLTNDTRTPEQVTARLDNLIATIRTNFHGPALANSSPQSDVLIIAHGHILRAFAMRWVGKTLADGPTFLLEAGGVGTLSYEHKNLEEPAILLGGSFMVEVADSAAGAGKEKGKRDAEKAGNGSEK